eukprot:3312521-Pleurochrysis_carterae.AAC.1
MLNDFNLYKSLVVVQPVVSAISSLAYSDARVANGTGSGHLKNAWPEFPRAALPMRYGISFC